jgi:DNA-binding beta-propeller fold protein YncE
MLLHRLRTKFMSIRSVLFSCLLLLFSCFAHAASSQQILAVVEENAGHVSFYQPENGKHLGSLKVGYLPHEITITKDGKTAYISNFGIKDYDSGAGIPGASISVIDIPNRVEKYRLFTFDPTQHKDYPQIDSAPHGLKLRPPLEKQLYVNIEKGGKVLVYDVLSKTIIKKLDVSPNTHNLFFSQDGKILWLMAGKDGVIRMDPDTGKITGTFTLSTPIRGLKYTPDLRYLMVSAVNQIVFIDPVTLEIKKQFTNLGVGPILYSDITPNQKLIVAPAAFDNQVVIINVETGTIAKRLVTGLNPVTVLIDAEGRFAYVTNATDKHVSKIDLTTFEPTNIATKDGPNGIAFVSNSSNDPHKKLILGVMLPLSGQDAQRGRDMMRGYEFWRLLNEHGGGLYTQDQVYDVDIVYLDTQSDLANIPALTNELITKYRINILLSTYGSAAYNIEKQIAIENHVPITPSQTNESPWLPNEMATGFDYFITTQFYDQNYYAQYNFKASNYSASASALGIVLQKALLEAGSLDYEILSKLFDQNKFDVFYAY